MFFWDLDYDKESSRGQQWKRIFTPKEFDGLKYYDRFLNHKLELYAMVW